MLITRGACVLALLCVTLTAGCSGGGGGDDQPVIPWGRFRSNAGNQAFANGTLDENQGAVTSLLTLGPTAQHPGVDGLPVSVGGLTNSTPVIGLNETIYLGTTAGLLVIDRDAATVRLFDACDLNPQSTRTPGSPCLSQNGCQAVGSVNGTAATTVNDEIVFGDDSGRVFAVADDGRNFTCLWVYPAIDTPPLPGPVLSSPLVLSDASAQTLTNVYVGVATGHLQALNAFGTQQWRYPSGSAAFPSALTSSVATDGTFLIITAPDGFLYTLDRAGRLQHQANISVPGAGASELLASPVSGTSTYAVGSGGHCGDSILGCLDAADCNGAPCDALGSAGLLTALTPLNDVRWRFATDAPIAGSATFAIQAIDEPVPPLSTPTPSTETPTPDGSTPTPTPTRLAIILQGVIYMVDSQGSVYGVKDADGGLIEVRPTVPTPEPTSTTVPGANTPTPPPTATPAQPRAAKAQLFDPVGVNTSPVLSADLFVVYGTVFGELYALRLDYDRTIPCTECDVNEWAPISLRREGCTGEDCAFGGGGKVTLALGQPAVSSPIIDREGRIYMTVGDVETGVGTLFTVGTP